ncbi:Oxidoreductase [Magnetospirillum sp. LM-5]|uniref:aldo/keto reductase n=1 Tax=Magnetospirillum sp. LM-5 TaxID=2681466 RepID=UPI001381C7EE|nr:aldo/keto reductase [Magnetospirillum sp. LM-5]CAA7613780.1 Oxidoreductase [Magnetospirillum sp. LM-5]
MRIRRAIGPFDVAGLSLGCMNLSHAYGTPPDRATAERVLLTALDRGVDFFDTAALYGFGANESLVGPILKPYRDRIVLASKCGMTGVDGKRVIDGRPETIKRTCDEALARLGTEVIDLYYLHRLDKQVPIEDSTGALADLVTAGKIRTIGLSEVSAATIRRAHSVHPVTAVQSEYSLWTRNPEIAVLETCRELGAALVAFSPLARGFLTGTLTDPARQLEDKDIRRQMPRFDEAHYRKNLDLLPGFFAIAAEIGCTPAQLALAWVLSKGDHIVALFGTKSTGHLEENLGADAVALPADITRRLDQLINPSTVSGARYNPATQSEIDTEEFDTGGNHRG